ncbi:hypothetical protein F3I58_21210 [Pantoea sp. VH_4]|nr:hypothetical protein [Pantoea sp. FN_2b]KAA5923423.1 hypothetical protein F3I59_20995 [Pantoea sp. VH_8]KAA5929167.1 hypothetical protein F3I58_21210 [Pantoea sp. VH_4]KAA5980135.1 hypothetical protein F3I49_20890 [Pantoea sp. M_4]KAA6043713.1 hypothetical protein F3I36_15925 [Pantoea sp. FN_2b]
METFKEKGNGVMKMYAVIYKPTGVPVGLFVDADNAIKRCRFLSDSKDFVVCKVQIKELEQVNFKRNGEDNHEQSL